jgi:hypothetical protein
MRLVSIKEAVGDEEINEELMHSAVIWEDKKLNN